MAIDLDVLDAAINTLAAQLKWDYKNGNFSIKKSDQMEQLVRARESALANPTAEVETMAFDFDINEFGVDNTQYEP